MSQNRTLILVDETRAMVIYENDETGKLKLIGEFAADENLYELLEEIKDYAKKTKTGSKPDDTLQLPNTTISDDDKPKRGYGGLD